MRRRPRCGRSPTFAELDVVQLHGHESVQDAATAWPRVIKALARDRDLLEQAEAWSDEVTLLVDAATGDAPGGTGQLADWPAAAALARERRVVLAGGLTPDNVADAVAVVRPYAVDVSSGIEVAAGSEIGQPHAGVRLGGRIGVEAG